MRVYLAGLATRHFYFEAAGASREEAVQALADGLRVHAEQFNIPLDWWRQGFEDLPDDEIFDVHSYVLGKAYRDQTPLRS